jgi:glycine/serine hydroxymethyltransferase
MKEPHMAQIAGWMAETLAAGEDEAAVSAIRSRVRDFTSQFPLHIDVDMGASRSL